MTAIFILCQQNAQVASGCWCGLAATALDLSGVYGYLGEEWAKGGKWMGCVVPASSTVQVWEPVASGAALRGRSGLASV